MKRRKKKRKLIIKIIISSIALILSIVSFVLVCKVGIIPMKYLLLFAGLLLIMNALGILGLFKLKVFGKILSTLMYLIIVALSIVCIKYISSFIGFFENGFGLVTETMVYDVLVLKDSKYESLDDLENLKIGYMEFENSDLSYLDILKKNVNVNFEKNSFLDLYNNFINEDLDAIVVNDSYIEIYNDYKSGFDDLTRVLYSFEVEIEVDDSDNSNVKSTCKANDNSKTIYISGSDARDGTLGNSYRSDVNMIVTFNLDTHEILIVSIPRDLQVQIHGTTGLKDKLTDSAMFGSSTLIKTVEDTFNINIDYIVKVGFNGLVNLVDIIGGIDVYSDKWFQSGNMSGYTFVEGVNHLDGKKALAYARERYAYKESDKHRIQNQYQVIEAIIKKVSTDKSVLLNFDDIVDELQGLYVTDIPSSLIKQIATEQISNMPSWKIKRLVIDGSDLRTECYTSPGVDLFVYVPDMETINKAVKAINALKCSK